MKIVLLIATCVALSFAEPSVRQQWLEFKKQHKKSFLNPTEEHYRITIFAKNLKLIEEHNAKYAAGSVPYRMRMNQFGDMLPEEVSDKLNGFNKTGQLNFHKLTGLSYTYPDNVELPETVDWREKGAVTPVKDQGNCGGCWAFSTTGALEGHLFRKTGKLVSLSEQQLIDCSGEYGNLGCQGGLMDNAFKYIKDNGGVATEESYPYEGEDGKCRFKSLNAVEGTSIKFHVDLPGKEKDLQAAVATVGPVSVAISAASPGFLHYGGGIFNGDTCATNQLDHGVLLVGYGTEEGHDYWIIKNSWNSGWGEEGYMRLIRNKGNVCGIASMASYPVL